MHMDLFRNWWVVALRGVLAIIFGIAAFAQPGAALGALAIIFGVYALLDGIMAIVHMFTGRTERKWWSLLLEGICGIAAGVLAFAWPGLTLWAFLNIVAAWAIVTGIFEIITAIQLRKEIEGEWLLGLGGVLSILLGFVLVASPGRGLVTLAWVLGTYAFLFGITLIALGFEMRRMGRQLESRIRGATV